MTTSPMDFDTRQIRVVFFQVKKPSEKLARLIETTTVHFEKKENFLIAVENETTAQYIDELLWKTPPTSFLPHQLSEEPLSALIAITRSRKNVNQAQFIFNLCPTPLIIEDTGRMIYDFEDMTSPSKQRLSAQRFDAYKKAGWLIEAR